MAVNCMCVDRGRRRWAAVDEIIFVSNGLPLLVNIGNPVIKTSSCVEQQLYYLWFSCLCFMWEQVSNQGWQKSGSTTDLCLHREVKGIWSKQDCRIWNLIWLRAWISSLELFLSLKNTNRKITCSQLCCKVNKLSVGRLLAL